MGKRALRVCDSDREWQGLSTRIQGFAFKSRLDTITARRRKREFTHTNGHDRSRLAALLPGAAVVATQALTPIYESQETINLRSSCARARCGARSRADKL